MVLMAKKYQLMKWYDIIQTIAAVMIIMFIVFALIQGIKGKG